MYGADGKMPLAVPASKTMSAFPHVATALTASQKQMLTNLSEKAAAFSTPISSSTSHYGSMSTSTSTSVLSATTAIPPSMTSNPSSSLLGMLNSSRYTPSVAPAATTYVPTVAPVDDEEEEAPDDEDEDEDDDEDGEMIGDVDIVSIE